MVERAKSTEYEKRFKTAKRTPKRLDDLDGRLDEAAKKFNAAQRAQWLALIVLLGAVVCFVIALVSAMTEEQNQVDKADQLLRELESRGSIE